VVPHTRTGALISTGNLDWATDGSGTWTASYDGTVVGTVTYGRDFLVESQDRSVHGNHHTLESAKAQLDARFRWVSEHR
jgi:hypothetical protein